MHGSMEMKAWDTDQSRNAYECNLGLYQHIGIELMIGFFGKSL